jgi:spermidine/putrescine transport system permease protein
MSDATVATTPAGAERTESIADHFRGWFANPWGRPRFLVIFTWAYMAWSIVPVFFAVMMSFNSGRSTVAFQGFSLYWWFGDPDAAVFTNPDFVNAIVQSLKLAAGDMLIATPIGVALALGLARWRGRGRSSANFLMLFPLVTPEIVMGTALFLVFTNLFDAVSLGTPAQLLGHVTFSISYVVIVVRGRLFAIGREYEEAAMDLGASPIGALRRVLLPMLGPAIFASAMIVFAISIDDFVISTFLLGGQESNTVPVLIYQQARGGPRPSLNGVASVMLFGSMIAIGLALLVQGRFMKRREASRRSAVEEFARFEL